MHPFIQRRILCVLTFALVLSAPAAFPQSEDLGHGFRHHGLATPFSNNRGIVTALDGAGRPVALCWLFDHRGGYAILVIDAETGKSQQVDTPFPPGEDCPYASIFSTGKKYYTHFNSWFSEFDPVNRSFTFYEKTADQMAMSMTEDDKGRIWSATYPQSGVVCFDPKERKLRDYGHVYPQNWKEYPRSIAADDAGWVYFGVGSTANQIIILDPETGKATPVVPEDKRGHGSGFVQRSLDGKVYGRLNDAKKDEWYSFYKGRSAFVGAREMKDAKPYIAGSQTLFERQFADGRRIKELNLIDRILVVENSRSGAAKSLPFTYTSEGAHIMGLATAPGNTICGGTAFPMRFFSYDPATDRWVNRETYGQWNTVGRQGDRFFVGGYTGGFLLEWDPAKPWVRTERDKIGCNPLFLVQSTPTINRPHRLLPYPDGRLVIMAGGPDYGLTGGGMLIWNRPTKSSVLLTDKDLIPDQTTIAMAALPGNKILGGSTTAPGTGGEKKAKEAELYVLDLTTRKIEWHKPVFPGVQEYTELCPGRDGLIYGFTDRTRFFVFDPAKKAIVYEQATETAFGLTAYQQGPRVFVHGPKGQIYLLFAKGIAILDPATFRIRMLAESPVPVLIGGDFLNGRIYFGNGSHLYSWTVTE